MKTSTVRIQHTALAAAALLVMAQPALAANCTWNPATGNWATAANWSCGAVPGAADTATIAGGKTVTVDTARSIGTLNNAGQINIDAFSLSLLGGTTTNTGGMISIANGSVLNQSSNSFIGGVISTTGTGALLPTNSNSNFLTGVTLNGLMDQASAINIQRVFSGLTLNGTVNLNNNSVLSFNGDQTLGGTGSVILGNTGASNRALSMEGSMVLTIGSGVTVKGQNGTLGQAYLSGGNQSMVNNGRIAADVSGGTINLSPSNGITNNGVLEAKNGGTLALSSNVVGGALGSISADVGSTVLQNGVALSGNISTFGNGTFRASNSNSNFLNGVAFTGTLDLATATGIERVTGGLTLNGTVNVNNNSVLSFNGDQTLGGNGTVVLGGTGASNRALSMEGSTVLTIGSNVTVRGQNGTIGQAYQSGGNQSMVNNGRIAADVSGGTINLAPSNGLTNNGVLEAKNGGTLALSGNVVGGALGSISADVGSTVLQNGVALSGNISTSGNGTFRASNSNSNFLNGVAFMGTLDLATATGIERVTGGLTLNGTVNVNNNSVLSFNGDQTLGGNGTVVLGGTGASNRALSMEGSTVLTIGSNVTVRGQNGTVGQAYQSGGNQSMVNNGRIAADVSGGTINLSPSNGITNNGVLEAKNGGTLVLNSAVIGNVGSSIASGVGSLVLQNGASLSGTINTTGTGTFRAANSNSNFLDGVTFNGTLDLAGATGIERVSNGLTLNGTVNVNNNSVLSFNGTQTLGGNGNVVLGNTGASNRALSMEGSMVLTIGSDVTVKGENGTIGQAYLSGGNQSIVNNGRIAANVGGGTVFLSPSNGVTNNGVLEAQNGGTLVLNSAVIGNVGSSIASGVGSLVLQNGVALSGTINTTGTGTFRAANSNSNFLDGVTFNGTLDLAGATGIERVTGGLTLKGAVNLNNNSVLSFNGTQTLGGNGTVVLGNTGASNRALSMEGSTVLTIGSGITVRGQNGTLGQAYLSGGNQQMVNNGRIAADVNGGTITVAPANGLVNNGTLATASGATMVLPANFSNAGRMEGTGTFSVSGTLTNEGTLAPGDSIGTLALTGNFLQTTAGTFDVDLESLASHDLFNISGTASLDGTLALYCLADCSYGVGDSFVILDSVGNLTGTFASVSLNGFATGAFNVVYDTALDRVLLQVTQDVTAAVPEPEGWALMLAGMGVLGWWARRKQTLALPA